MQLYFDPGTGRVLIERWGIKDRDPSASQCPQCGADLMRVGIIELAYVFTACDCGTPDYPHLIEQLWHRACFLEHGSA